MVKRKDFDSCISEKQLVETGYHDRILAKELLELVLHRKQFWEEANLAARYPSMYLEGYYEIIKELSLAILALDGWKALNHECLFSYLKKKKPELELDFEFLLDLKDTRNAIDYRGIKIGPDSWKNNELSIRLTISCLQEYIKKRISNT